MKKTSTPLERLISRARESVEQEQLANDRITMPLGFATRVVARASLDFGRASMMVLIERRAWRALALSGGIAVVAAILNFHPVTEAIEDEMMTVQDPVTVVLNLS